MTNVKCPICGKTFDKSKVEYIHINGRYYDRIPQTMVDNWDISTYD